MQVFEIPLTPATNQRFSISLTGTTYGMTVKWSPPSSCWVIDIADINGEPLISGIPMITGIDLLQQYEYVGIAASLVVQTDFAPDQVPGFDDLGKTGHLFVETA